MSAMEVYKLHYVHLVKLLPMDDAVFIAELYSRDVLTDHDRDLILSQSTRANKALVFLNNTIQPSMHQNDSEKLYQLLECMENSDFTVVKELAQRIKGKLHSG